MSKRRHYISDIVHYGPRGSEPHEGFVEVPKGNDRMFDIVLFNRGRRQTGTATVHRLIALFAGIKRRHPRFRKSKVGIEPIVVRTKIGGGMVMIVKPLPGPVASIATRQ